MTFDKFMAYVEESRSYSSAEMFMAEIGYGEDVPYSPDNWARVCEIIYASARADIKTIAGGMTARGFALRYGIAPRTAQDWISGEHSIQPPYALAIGFAVISNIEYGDPDKLV